MKNILRSFLVMAITVVTLSGATSAYFTANVSATGNQITTGVMTAYLGTYLAPTGDRAGQWVAYAEKGVNNVVGNFPVIANVEPGEMESGYVVVANTSATASTTIPFRYQGSVTGAWSNPALSASMMTVPMVHRYAANNCEADAMCEDIYYWLIDNGYTNISASAADFVSPSTIGGNSAEFELAYKQFTIYRVDLMLSTTAGNEYQGETFNYTVNLNTKQVNAPSF